MATQTPSARDTRIDVIRALALITIFVNHVPGNPLEFLTTKNFGFSDAAEAFVLLSGVAAGLAYGARFSAETRLAATLKMWRRAGVLYITQLGTTMATLGIFAFFALHFAAPRLLEAINIGPVIDDTAASLLGIVTFGHQLGYNNILSMYAVVLLLAPLFLLLANRFGLFAMVAASCALWLAAGLLRLAPANYPNAGTWFLNPLSWQFLFVIGMAGTMHVRRGGSLFVRPWLVAIAGTYLLVAFAWVRIPLWGIDTSLGLPAVLTGFDKSYLSAPRLLHVLAAAYLVAVLPWINERARLSPDNALAMMGRHALPVFVTGTILSMVAQAWRMVHEPDPFTDIAIVTGGILLQFSVAFYIEWYRRVTQGGWRAAPTSGISAGHDPRPAKPARIAGAAAPSQRAV